MSNLKRILIVELSLGHFELIPSHLHFLKKRKYEVFFLGIEESKQAISRLAENFSATLIIQKPKNIKELFEARSFVKQHNIGQILFNSASGRSTLLLSLLLPSKLYLCGVLHNIEKLKQSNTQKMIAFRVKKFLTLSRFLYEQTKSSNFRKLSFSYFYPIYFGQSKISPSINKRTKIVIPGKLENTRRDYLGLIKTLTSINIELLKNFNFVLLGNINKHDGKEIFEFIKKRGLLEIFEFHQNFIPDIEFQEIIAKSDYIMPLTYPSKSVSNKYDQYKISGAFNLAFAYKKPLLIHEGLKKTREFEGISFFYNLINLNGLLNQLLTTDSLLLVNSYIKDRRFDQKLQEERFFSIIK